MPKNTMIVIPDGEVDQARYWHNQAGRRVLHLLKEPTKPKRRAPSEVPMGLPEIIRTCACQDDGTVKGRLWKVSARRSYAVKHGLPPWEQIKGKEQSFADAFLSSSVVNMNDTIPPRTKRSRSSNRELLRAAKDRWDDRREKIISLKPDVVICGGTYWLLKRLLDEDNEPYETPDKAGARHIVWQGIPFVYAYHPAFSNKKHPQEYGEFRSRCMAALGI